MQSVSPSIDNGNNPTLYYLAIDFEGDTRKTNGNADALKITDIGADEFVLDTDSDNIPDDGDNSGIIGDWRLSICLRVHVGVKNPAERFVPGCHLLPID